MPYQELPGLGMRGLNTDTPPQALDHTQFSDGNNMRPFDGSLQTVFDFDASPDNNIAPAIGQNPAVSRRDVVRMVSWIETGSNALRLAYLWDDGDSDGSQYNVQIINDLTASTNLVSGANAQTDLNTNTRWGIQMLAFNGVLILNDSINQPVLVTTDDDDNYVAQYVQGWLSQDADNPDTEQAAVADRITCERIVPYNGRLVALNLGGQGEYVNDKLGNASIVWSTPIDELGSLNNVTFRFTATNSAGDDILTETPGEVVDGGVCGQYLIIYKDDAIYRYVDTGAPLYLVGEVIYNDDGIFSPDCFVDIGGGRHVVLGNFGVYIHDGGPNRQNISRGRIQQKLYSDIEYNRKDSTFLFHHENDNEVWICIPSTDNAYCDKAYIYNYDLDTWYTRDLPNVRDIISFQKDGILYIYCITSIGVYRLFDERRISSAKYKSGSVEFHYLGFGDHSKVKHLSAVYPHCMGTVGIDIAASNNVGSTDNPFPDTDANPLLQTFNGVTNQYKIDYRVHGRYYHIKVNNTLDDNSNGTNPQMTGMGFEMKIGGDR